MNGMSSRVEDTDGDVRAAVFAYLDNLVNRSADGSLRSRDINAFRFQGRALRLIVQSGIRKPQGLKAALTIRTTYTPPGGRPPYLDDAGADGLIRYKIRGDDPGHADNRALREAMVLGLPLVYFVGVGKGVYVPRYPVWIVREDEEVREFSVAVDEGQRLVDLSSMSAPQRDYIARLTQARMHQPIFRAQVLRAYASTCAMCRLRHPELLDAAHILPDGHPRGEPVVQNGLALCKIHHAAFDRNLLGIHPANLVVDVKARILEEIDGPMLQHGLQEMAGTSLLLPRRAVEWPDRQRLAERYEEFQEAS